MLKRYKWRIQSAWLSARANLTGAHMMRILTLKIMT